MKDRLQADDPYKRRKATEIYFELASFDDVRAKLLELNADPQFALNFGGSAMAFSLNRFRAPIVWDKLKAAKLEGDFIGSPKEILERIALQAGLKLVPPPIERVHDQSWTMGRLEFRNPGRHLNLLDALQIFANYPRKWGGYSTWAAWNQGWWAILLEADQIRVLPSGFGEQEGRTFWREWLKNEAAKTK